MRKTIGIEEFRAALAGCERSAWRFEQQPSYQVDYERKQFEDFLVGDPEPPTENPDLRSWFDRVEAWTSVGKTVGRVRVVDDPITDYQRWMQWMDRWNREAGETIDYLPRRRAREAGLIPGAGRADWWLLDDSRLLLMNFAEDGSGAGFQLVENELEVFGARAVRDAVKALVLAGLPT